MSMAAFPPKSACFPLGIGGKFGLVGGCSLRKICYRPLRGRDSVKEKWRFKSLCSRREHRGTDFEQSHDPLARGPQRRPRLRNQALFLRPYSRRAHLQTRAVVRRGRAVVHRWPHDGCSSHGQEVRPSSTTPWSRMRPSPARRQMRCILLAATTFLCSGHRALEVQEHLHDHYVHTMRKENTRWSN
jgi:hypothetical protein